MKDWVRKWMVLLAGRELKGEGSYWFFWQKMRKEMLEALTLAQVFSQNAEALSRPD